MKKLNYLKVILLFISGLNISFSATSLEETIKTVRLDYQTPYGYESQILLGFMGDMATDGIDPGYDAVSPNNYPNQFYFKSNGLNLIIQGVGFFDTSKTFPLGILNDVSGIIKIKVNSTEGFDAAQNMYVYDSVTDTYHDIKNGIFEINLAAGLYENRFFLTFATNTVLASNNFDLNNEISVYVDLNNQINIGSTNTFSTVEIYNLNGQKVKNVLVENKNNLIINFNGFSTGIYVLNIKGNEAFYSKKIVVN